MAPIRDLTYWKERSRKAEERGDLLAKQIHDTSKRLGLIAEAFRKLEGKNEELQAALDIALVGLTLP